MKNGYTMVRRLKLTPFELRVAIDALNAKRLKQKASGVDNRETSNLNPFKDIFAIYNKVSCFIDAKHKKRLKEIIVKQIFNEIATVV